MRSNNAMTDMAAIMSKARAYSDSRLADVLAGKDVSIPQYVAMTEAMGRKQLRQAVDGAQAQQQSQQPSIKDQLLAEQSAPQMAAGIDQLPAANMESMDLAGGGIIAFEEGGSTIDKLKDFFFARGEFAPEKNRMSGAYKGNEPLQGEGVPGLYKQRQEEKRAKAADIKEQMRLNALQPEGFGEPKQVSGEDPYGVASGRTVDDLKGPGVSEPPITTQAAPKAAAPASGIAAISAPKYERRASPFEGMRAEAQDYDKLKSQGLGEGLMKMGAGLLSAPGSKGFAAGIQALADSGAVSRKEINSLKKDARDYDFNLKKAESAFEQGNDQLALKYMEAADLNKFRMASLAQEPGELRTLRAVANDPTLAGIYKGAGAKATLSMADATKQWNDLYKDNPQEYRRLQQLGVRSPSEYLQYAVTGLPPMQVVGTLDKGAVVRN
jgi:hypothetical protein